MAEGWELAVETIDSGRAAAKLAELQRKSVGQASRLSPLRKSPVEQVETGRFVIIAQLHVLDAALCTPRLASYRALRNP